MHSPIGLFHTIGQVPKGAGHPLAGHRKDGTHSRFVYDDVHVLGLQTTQQRGFGTGRRLRRVVEEVTATPVGHRKRGSGRQFVRMEPTFENEAACNVPVERFDVLLALGCTVVRCEVAERFRAGDPFAGSPAACAAITRERHSVSRFVTSPGRPRRRDPTNRKAEKHPEARPVPLPVAPV